MEEAQAKFVISLDYIMENWDKPIKSAEKEVEQISKKDSKKE